MLVNKPGGLLTQGPSGVDSLELRIKRYLSTQNGHSDPVYLGVPHRLDRPASGVMVFATEKKLARKLARQFENRQVQKTYWAVVMHCEIPDRDSWSDYMRKIPDRAQSEIVDADHPDAQLAVLNYQSIETTAEYRRLEIELVTGRTHQIRLQASSRGLPIVGDHLYGSTASFGPECEDQRERWIALHARRLQLTHPGTKEVIDQVAPLPCWWEQKFTREKPT